MNENPDQRRKELAMIHLAKKELGLDDDLYRTVLQQVCGAKSAGDLDEKGRRQLLAFFRSKGWGRQDHQNGKPHNFKEPSRSRLMAKIEAQLADAGRPWKYANAMVKRMFGIDRLAFCTPAQLGKVIAALSYDAKRRGKSAS
jgi:phage gp16-like protein